MKASAIALILISICSNIQAQHQHEAAPAKPAMLVQGLGEVNHPVSTKNAEAQRFFNQGMALVYGFNHDEAIRSFKRAAELDPNLAIAHWGVALANGPNINAPRDAERDKAAYEAIQKARALMANASAAERDYIEALTKRYSNDPKADSKKLDVDYKNAMADLVRRHPDDLDAALAREPGFRTKIASILIDAHGERLAVSAQPQGYPPDASWLPVERVPEANVVLADTRWPTGAQRLFEAAAQLALPSVFDGDGGDPAQVARTAQQSTHPFYSQPMLASFGYGAPEAALPRVFGGRNVVTGVTLGGAGVMWFDGERLHSLPSPRVKAVDTLAAGDTWHGALALALAEGRSTEDAIEFASAVAALKCTRFGGRASIPRRDEFEQWWAERRAAAPAATPVAE